MPSAAVCVIGLSLGVYVSGNQLLALNCNVPDVLSTPGSSIKKRVVVESVLTYAVSPSAVKHANAP